MHNLDTIQYDQSVRVGVHSTTRCIQCMYRT